MGQVWTIAGLSHVQRDVLLALADHAHDDGTSARPGVPYLAWKTEWGTRAVQGALRALEESGLIEAASLAGGRGRPTEYLLHLEKGARKAPLSTSTKGAADDVKGAADDAKGCTSASRVRKNHQEPSEPSRGRERQRNPIFDALAISCGMRLDAMTPEASRLCGIAASEIKRAGGTPEMIPAAVASYHRRYEGAAATPKAIANHWPAIAPRSAAVRAVCPECGVGGGAHVADCPRAPSD